MAPSSSLSPLFLLGALVAAVLAACSSGKPSGESGSAPGRGIYVPVEYQTARKTPGHRVHVGEHQVACSSCHELMETTLGSAPPTRCRSCHEKEASIAHASEQARRRFGEDAKADCTVCHAFSSQKAEQREDAAVSSSMHGEVDAEGMHAVATIACESCHRVDQGRTPAVAVHEKGGDCLKCHRPHEDASPKSAPCTTCHKEASLAHAAHGGDSGCKGCHTHQHGKAAEAAGTCETCHASHDPIVPASALFGTGHAKCESCHHPHEFEKSLAAQCTSCHQNVHVLAESNAPIHRQCTSCHNPHDVRGSPRFACAGCHASVHPDHPKPEISGGAASCITCHNPHPAGRSHEVSKACSSCHSAAKSEAAFHASTACVKCHAPHDFVIERNGKTVCGRCHEPMVGATAANTGHQDCAACHGGLPHEPTRAQGTCPSCHTQEHARVNKGHATCTSCHEPHAGAVTAACQNCHAAEARTAPSGHAECAKCHDQHSGATGRAPCASCHAKEASTKHGEISASCSSCHEPHGPSGATQPPPCASCHAKAKLPGLHAITKHKECKDCHSGHDAPAAIARGPCLSCHTDRTNHFPEAPRCVSCHLFE